MSISRIIHRHLRHPKKDAVTGPRVTLYLHLHLVVREEGSIAIERVLEGVLASASGDPGDCPAAWGVRSAADGRTAIGGGLNGGGTINAPPHLGQCSEGR